MNCLTNYSFWVPMRNVEYNIQELPNMNWWQWWGLRTILPSEVWLLENSDWTLLWYLLLIPLKLLFLWHQKQGIYASSFYLITHQQDWGHSLSSFLSVNICEIEEGSFKGYIIQSFIPLHNSLVASCDLAVLTNMLYFLLNSCEQVIFWYHVQTLCRRKWISYRPRKSQRKNKSA